MNWPMPALTASATTSPTRFGSEAIDHDPVEADQGADLAGSLAVEGGEIGGLVEPGDHGADHARGVAVLAGRRLGLDDGLLPEKWMATSNNWSPPVRAQSNRRSTASGPRNMAERLRRSWTALGLKTLSSGRPNRSSGVRPMKSATLADTRATSQSAVRAIRKPMGWIQPRISIGSRSQS